MALLRCSWDRRYMTQASLLIPAVRLLGMYPLFWQPGVGVKLTETPTDLESTSRWH